MDPVQSRTCIIYEMLRSLVTAHRPPHTPAAGEHEGVEAHPVALPLSPRCHPRKLLVVALVPYPSFAPRASGRAVALPFSILATCMRWSMAVAASRRIGDWGIPGREKEVGQF
jgi:hypothetical protein